MPHIEKRKVTLVAPTGEVATDYVPVDLVAHFVEDATRLRVDANTGQPLQRWITAVVGDTHDPGPDGDQGATHIPAHLKHHVANHPVLGQLPATHGPMLGESHLRADNGRVMAQAVRNPHHIEPAECPECAKVGG
jgi:hypothetical protein